MVISALYHTICKEYLLEILDEYCSIRYYMSDRYLGLLGKSAKHLVTNLYRASAIRSLLSGGCHMTPLILQAKCTNGLLSVQVDCNQMVISLRLLLIKLKYICLQHCVFTC